MKNYILFSTNDNRAYDNKSICIKADIEIEEFSERVSNVCKYNNFTVSPIGEPEGKVFTLDEAITFIGNIVLHKHERYIVMTERNEIELPAHVRASLFEGYTDRIILSLDFAGYNGISLDHDLLVNEHKTTALLLEIFPTLEYLKTRAQFIVRPKYSETQNTYYGIINGRVIAYEEFYGIKSVIL